MSTLRILLHRFGTIRGIGLVGAALLALALLLAALRGGAQAQATESPETIAVSRGSISDTLHVLGALAPEQTADLALLSSGMIAELPVRVGDQVHGGQPLVQVDSRDVQSQVAGAQAGLSNAHAQLADHQAQIEAAQGRLAQAQADLKSAHDGGSTDEQDKRENVEITANALRTAQEEQTRIFWETHNANGSWKKDPKRPSYKEDFNRFTTADRAMKDADARYRQAQALFRSAQLRKRNSISSAQAVVDQRVAEIAAAQASAEAARASVDQAAQTLTQAQLKLELTALTAPFDGVITAVRGVAGSNANAGSTIITVAEYANPRIDLKLNESEVVKLTVQQPVTITSDILDDWKASGRVSSIAPSAETSNGVVTYAVQVTVDHPDRRLRLGMTVGVAIRVGEKSDVLRVPNTALRPQDDEQVILVAGESGFSPVVVVTGLSDGAWTEIRAGDVIAGQLIARDVDKVPADQIHTASAH